MEKVKKVQISCILNVKVHKGSMRDIMADIRTEMKNILSSYSCDLAYDLNSATNLKVLTTKEI